jgi:hypothetical protein
MRTQIPTFRNLFDTSLLEEKNQAGMFTTSPLINYGETMEIQKSLLRLLKVSGIGKLVKHQSLTHPWSPKQVEVLLPVKGYSSSTTPRVFKLQSSRLEGSGSRLIAYPLSCDWKPVVDLLRQSHGSTKSRRLKAPNRPWFPRKFPMAEWEVSLRAKALN